MKNIIEKIVYPLVTCIFETFSLPQALSILVYSLFIKSTIKLFWAKDFSWSTIVKNRFWCCFMLSGFVLQLKFYLVMLCPINNICFYFSSALLSKRQFEYYVQHMLTCFYSFFLYYNDCLLSHFVGNKKLSLLPPFFQVLKGLLFHLLHN